MLYPISNILCTLAPQKNVEYEQWIITLGG